MGRSTAWAHFVDCDLLLIVVVVVVPDALLGMSADLARDYAQYVGDRVLDDFGLSRWFRVDNPVSEFIVSVLQPRSDA